MFVYCRLDKDETEKVVRNIEGYPGFVLLDLENASDRTISILGDNVEHIDTKIFVSAKKIKQITMQGSTNPSYSWENVKVDATTADKVATKHTTSSPYVFPFVDIDSTLCFYCEGWPALAKHWQDRKRNWPPENVIKEVLLSGYYLVPKAHPDAPLNHDIQWRLSFSAAEVILIDNFTGVQFLLYQTLKAVLKQNAAPHSGAEGLTTYHLKTALFWLSEKCPEDQWVDANISECITLVLTWIIDACVSAMLPHYFVPEINLLQKVPSDVLNEIVTVLENILKNFKVVTWEDSLTSFSYDTGYCVSLMAQRQIRMLPFVSFLTENPKQIVFELIQISLRRRHKQVLGSLVTDAVVACLFQKHFPEKSQGLKRFEYVMNCAYAALSFMSEKCLDVLMEISEKWFELFPTCPLAAYQLIEEKIVRSAGVEEMPIFVLEDLLANDNLEEFLLQSVTIAQNWYQKYIVVACQSIYVMLKAAFEVSSSSESMVKDLSPIDLIPQEVTNEMDKEFELPQESMLTIHDMSNDEIWLDMIPYERMVDKVAKYGHKKCSENFDCYSGHRKVCVEILQSKTVLDHLCFHKITCMDTNLLFVEGDQINYPTMMKVLLSQTSLEK